MDMRKYLKVKEMLDRMEEYYSETDNTFYKVETKPVDKDTGIATYLELQPNDLIDKDTYIYIGDPDVVRFKPISGHLDDHGEVTRSGWIGSPNIHRYMYTHINRYYVTDILDVLDISIDGLTCEQLVTKLMSLDVKQYTHTKMMAYWNSAFSPDVMLDITAIENLLIIFKKFETIDDNILANVKTTLNCLDYVDMDSLKQRRGPLQYDPETHSVTIGYESTEGTYETTTLYKLGTCTVDWDGVYAYRLRTPLYL